MVAASRLQPMTPRRTGACTAWNGNGREGPAPRRPGSSTGGGPHPVAAASRLQGRRVLSQAPLAAVGPTLLGRPATASSQAPAASGTPSQAAPQTPRPRISSSDIANREAEDSDGR